MIASNHWRAESLAEVAQRSTSFAQFAYEVADFLHHFQASPCMDALTEEPPLLNHAFSEGGIADAYLAAIAVELAASIGQPRPGWAQKPERFRHEPWFATPGRHMRALLLVESPPGFRERNLFVTANALSVA